MKCPACFNPLTEVEVGQVKVDVCQNGCGGIWFDAFELQQVDQEEEETGNPLLHIRRDENITVDPSRKRECPRCGNVKLHRHYFSAKRQVQVDECPQCGGYWLDGGELAQIRAEKRQEMSQEPADSPTISSKMIRYLYRLRLEEVKDRS
jgi:Zn-finger nucleic acid-binding protein